MQKQVSALKACGEVIFLEKIPEVWNGTDLSAVLDIVWNESLWLWQCHTDISHCFMLLWHELFEHGVRLIRRQMTIRRVTTLNTRTTQSQGTSQSSTLETMLIVFTHVFSVVAGGHCSHCTLTLLTISSETGCFIIILSHHITLQWPAQVTTDKITGRAFSLEPLSKTSY